VASIPSPIGRGLRAFRLQQAGVVYALVAVVACFQILTITQGFPAFLSVADVRNILDLTALDGVLVVSMTVLLISGNFDLSIGATAGLSGAVGLTVANAHGAVLGTLAAVGVGLGVGTVNGVLVQIVGVNAFIVTLGSLTAVQGLLLILTNGNTVLANSGEYASIGTGDWTLGSPAAIVTGVILLLYAGARVYRARLDRSAVTAAVLGVAVIACGIALPGLLKQTRETWIMLGYMTAAALVLRFTVLGRRVYAVGGNPEASRLSGINVNRYRIGAFLLTGVSASLAGLLYAGKFAAVNPSALTNEELPVLAAAILGGTSLFGGSGYVVKSVIGALILASLGDGFNVLNLGANYQYLVQGAVIIAAASVYTVAGRRRTAAVAAKEPPPAQPSPQLSLKGEGVR
jgi:D-xylose transport system permease protein